MGGFLGKLIRRAPPLLWYLLLAMLFYAPLLLGLRTFPDGDFTDHFLPFSLFQQSAIRTWQLPLWNPHTYSGHPFLADTQAAVFYPVSNLLLLLTLPWDGPGARLYWLQVEAMIHVALAGWFTFLLVRTLTGKRWAAFLAGFCFAFSGYLTGYPPLQLAVLRTAIWLPLVLWCLVHAVQKPEQWRWWIGAALSYVTMFFAGHPQTFLHSSYVLGAWVVWLVGVRPTPFQPPPTSGEEQHTPSQLSPQGTQREERLTPSLPAGKAGVGFVQVGFGILAFFLLSLALSAAQLLPSLEFTGLSVRANVDYAYVSGGFPLQDSWQLLLPGVLTQFSPLYIGVIGLGLALIGAATRPPFTIRRSQVTIHRSPFPVNNLLLLIFILFLLLSYGDNSFLYPVFYRFAPGWNLFRGQERAAFIVAFSLSLLAGVGAAALPHLIYRVRRLLAVGFAILVSAGVYTFGVLWQLLGQSAVNQWHYLLIAMGTILAALVLVVCMVLPGWDRRREVLLIGTLLLNLFVANMGTNLGEFGPIRKTILAPEMEAVQAAVSAEDNDSVGLPGRVYNEFRVYEDYAMRLSKKDRSGKNLSVEDVWGSSPLRLARYAALFDEFPLDRMWRLTGVDTVLTWRRELFVPSTLLAEFPQMTDTTYLHSLSTPDAVPNPRAWMVAQIQVADDEATLAALADHAVDLNRIAFLSPEFAGNVTDHEPGVSIVHLSRLSAQALAVNVYSEQGGLLVVSENWMPGWRVETVNCPAPTTVCATTESPIPTLPLLQPLRANLTLLGIVVPRDEVTFILRYRPQSVQLGVWISGSALLLVLLLGSWRAWRRLVN